MCTLLHQGLATILGMRHIQPPQPGGIYEHAGRVPERIDCARIPSVEEDFEVFRLCNYLERIHNLWPYRSPMAWSSL